MYISDISMTNNNNFRYFNANNTELYDKLFHFSKNKFRKTIKKYQKHIFSKDKCIFIVRPMYNQYGKCKKSHTFLKRVLNIWLNVINSGV